jgi:hypothetical protein
MGEIVFGKTEQPVEAIAGPVATTPAPTNAVVVVAPAPAVPARANSNLLLGDWLPSFEDIIIPRLNIVQNMGDLKDQYEAGSLIYDQNTVLFVPGKANKDGSVARAATPAVNMTVLGFRPTRFVEKTAGGAKGQIVKTLAEVAAAGGTTDYKEWKLKEKSGMKLFQPLADALVAIERPDSIPDDDTVFLYEVEGKKYTLALWAMKGSVYTEGAKKVFFTARRMGVLAKGGYPSFGFAVTTFEKQYGTSNKAWVPICKPTKASTPDFINWVKGVLNPDAAPADAESAGA